MGGAGEGEGPMHPSEVKEVHQLLEQKPKQNHDVIIISSTTLTYLQYQI